jgi:predicted membrane chloride channel (bestrophin family)
MENCEIKKVLKATAENNDLYYMQVKFSHCTSKELRENLIKEELRNRFPIIGNRTIYVKEYLGKMYNEYKYEIKAE